MDQCREDNNKNINTKLRYTNSCKKKTNQILKIKKSEEYPHWPLQENIEYNVLLIDTKLN